MAEGVTNTGYWPLPPASPMVPAGSCSMRTSTPMSPQNPARASAKFLTLGMVGTAISKPSGYPASASSSLARSGS